MDVDTVVSLLDQLSLILDPTERAEAYRAAAARINSSDPPGPPASSYPHHGDPHQSPDLLQFPPYPQDGKPFMSHSFVMGPASAPPPPTVTPRHHWTTPSPHFHFKNFHPHQHPSYFAPPPPLHEQQPPPVVPHTPASPFHLPAPLPGPRRSRAHEHSHHTHYAVHRGYTVRIYPDWPSCNTQVAGYPNNMFSGFASAQYATAYLHATSDAATHKLAQRYS